MNGIAQFVGYIVLVLFALGLWRSCSEREGVAADASHVSQATKPAAAMESGAPEATGARVERAPIPAEPQRTADTFTLEDRSVFIAQEDAHVFSFKIVKPVDVAIVVDVRNESPIDVVTTRGIVSPLNYVLAASMHQVSEVLVALSGNDQDAKDVARENPFSNRLSSKGVYRTFASRWVYLGPGEYSVVLDNSGTFTPSRGDAPCRLRVLLREHSS